MSKPSFHAEDAFPEEESTANESLSGEIPAGNDLDLNADLSVDPAVDEDLRQFLQAFSTGPTAEEQSRFWDDLSHRLDEAETEPSAQSVQNERPSPRLLSLPLRRSLPWLSAASGLVVVLLLLVPLSRQSELASFSDRVVQDVQQAESRVAEDFATEAEAPMVLGAPAPQAEISQPQKVLRAPARRSAKRVSPAAPPQFEVAKEAKAELQQPAFLRAQSDSNVAASAEPGFEWQWQQLSETLFTVRFASQHEAAFLQLTKTWPEEVQVTRAGADVATRAKELAYRVEINITR